MTTQATAIHRDSESEKADYSLKLARRLEILSCVTPERPAMEQRLTDTLLSLRDSQAKGREAVSRAEDAEAACDAAEQRLRTLQEAGLDAGEFDAVARMDSEALMQRLIFRVYLASLQAEDRRLHGLASYRLGPGFVASLHHRKITTPRGRIAFACATVACGRAAELPGLEFRQWRSGSGTSEDPHTAREDGSKGWLCSIGQAGPSATCLYYWTTQTAKSSSTQYGRLERCGQRA